jgi:BirA family biotin operon repressor/biotin-[acetyl-CoA-carboxylase] ligase
VDAAKLGGILVETRSAGQQTLAVIGVGINCQLAPGLARRLRRPLASLDQHIGPTDRNVVIRDIVKALLESIAKFEAGGLAELRREWEALDANAGRRLRVRLAGGRVVSGVSSGLTPEGGLRLATRGGVRAVTSGRIL